MRHPFRVENIDRWGSNWPLGAKMCLCESERFGAKSQFLYGDRDFCQQGISQVYPGLQLSHSDHPQKNFRFRARGHFLGSPLFLAVLGLCHDRGISTLNFGPISTKLGGNVRAIKK